MYIFSFHLISNQSQCICAHVHTFSFPLYEVLGSPQKGRKVLTPGPIPLPVSALVVPICFSRSGIKTGQNLVEYVFP